MKTATKKGMKQEVLTSDDVRRMMEEAVAKGKKKVNLSGRTIESIDFNYFDIPVGLDLRRAKILDTVSIRFAKFTGGFIILDYATVKGGVVLGNLGDLRFSLFLRHARVTYDVSLFDVNIDKLCVVGLRSDNGRQKVHIIGNTTFHDDISWDPRD